MRYFMDSEFVERGPDYPIELISIGMVAEDGRVLYMQSVEFSIDKASPWVREHVILPLDVCPHIKTNPPYSLGTIYGAIAQHQHGQCVFADPVKGIAGAYADCPWRTRAQIKQEILHFMDIKKYGKPEIWTYYGAYDHVVFCQIFGTMMDLPDGFPMHTMDIKQWCNMLGNPPLPRQGKGEHNALADAHHNQVMWKFLDAWAKTK